MRSGHISFFRAKTPGMDIAMFGRMARLPRLVIPGLAHHITQRGNRRQRTFFDRQDYETYLQCMRLSCTMYGVKIWSYSLMPNHTHLIVVPFTKEGLSKAIARGHEAYTRYINFKMKWRGYFWQGRFSSFPMDDVHLYHAHAYVELNPVKAKMVELPENYEWSSARAHMGLEDNEYLDDIELIVSKVDDWKKYLLEAHENSIHREIEKHEKTGRPLGSENFLKDLETELGIQIIPKKAGRRPKPK